MSSNQLQHGEQPYPPQSYPPTGQAEAYTMPPPIGYPMRDGAAYPPQQSAPVETKSRGDDDGFWKGW